VAASDVELTTDDVAEIEELFAPGRESVPTGS
jgi:hypothetical protein